MKLLVALCVFAVVGFAAAKPARDRGCLWIMGRCAEECPVGTRSYSLDYFIPEATCENPEPNRARGALPADFSACYCDSPTVRDTTSNKCVALDQCPKKE